MFDRFHPAMQFARLARYLGQILAGGSGSGSGLFGRDHHVSFRPVGAELRDPNDPAQAARIAAAEAKRERKADKLCRDATLSYWENPCISAGCPRANPFNIAR